MKRTILFVAICLLLVVAVQAAPISLGQSFLTVSGNAVPKLQVDVWAEFGARTAGLWTWTYDVTAVGIMPSPDGVKGFSINLGSPEAMMANNITTNAVSWTGYKSSGQVFWEMPPGGLPDKDRLDVGETFEFQFDHLWGPSENHSASAQDTYGFFGPVAGPAVPEPMSIMNIMFGIMGLGSAAGFRKLRRK